MCKNLKLIALTHTVVARMKLLQPLLFCDQVTNKRILW